MKKFVSVLLCMLMVISVMVPIASAATAKPEPKLQFGEDGKFTILNVSDIQDKENLMGVTADLIKGAMEKVQPDLVILTGDNIAGYRTKDAAKTEKGIRAYMDIFETYNVPVAIVYGNHDEYDSGLSKAQQMEIYESYKCNISVDEDYGKAEDDPTNLEGCGTYDIPIYSSKNPLKVAFECYMFDTGDRDENGDYDHVREKQLEWYKNRSNELKLLNWGKPVPAMAFQHIIVPEIFEALDEVDASVEGAKPKNGKYYALPATAKEGSVLGESPCPSGINGGEFDAFLEQGDVIGVVSGHDHTNSFVVPYKGIDLINTPTCGFRSYGTNETRGVRVIELDESDLTTYTTRIVTYDELYGNDSAKMFTYKFLGMIGSIYSFFYGLWSKVESFFVGIFG